MKRIIVYAQFVFAVLRVIANVTEFSDPENEAFRVDALENLHLILELCEDRVKWHAKTILEMLTRLLYEFTKNQNQTLLQLSTSAFKKTAILAPDEFNALFESIEEISVNAEFDSIVTETRQALE